MATNYRKTCSLCGSARDDIECFGCNVRQTHDEVALLRRAERRVLQTSPDPVQNIVWRLQNLIRAERTLHYSRGDWKTSRLSEILDNIHNHTEHILSMYDKEYDVRIPLGPLDRDQAMGWAITMENCNNDARTFINQMPKDKRTPGALMETAIVKSQIKRVKTIINTQQAEMQFDAVEGVLSAAGGALMETVLNMGTAFIGDLVRTEPNRDSPAQISVDSGDWALSDVPRQVGSVGFHKFHQAPQSKNVVQQLTQKSMSLQQRFQEKALVMSLDVQSPCATTPQLLVNFSVSPQIFNNYTGTPTTFIDRDMTPLGYFADFYRLWRGDLKFTFQVIATEFHQGQFFIAFNPNNDLASPTDLLGASNLISVSFDISQKNEVTLEIPYVSDSDFKTVVPDYGIGTATSGAVNRPWNAVPIDSSVGMIWVYIQNKIFAPPTVNPTFFLNIWIQAGENFSYHVPVQPRFQTMVAGEMQMMEEPTDATDESQIKTAHDVEPGTSADGIDAENPIDPVTEIQTADTTNVMTRPYLVQTDIVWDTTQHPGDMIWTASLPELLFTKPTLAPKGILDYHEFYRSGWRVTLSFSAPKQVFGLAVLLCHPLVYDRDFHMCSASFTQLPHAFLDVGRQKTVSLDVPWMDIYRMMRVKQDSAIGVARLGYVKLMCVNPLRTPPDACANVQGSVHLEPLKCYVGVKKLGPGATVSAEVLRDYIPATMQADEKKVESTSTGPPIGGKSKPGEGDKTVKKSDTETKESKKGSKGEKEVSSVQKKEQDVRKPFKPRNPPKKSFISAHDSVYDLMKRPKLIPGRAFVAPAANDWTLIRRYNPIANPIMMKIMTTYAFWNGSVRVHFNSGTTVARDIQLLFQPNWTNTWQAQETQIAGGTGVNQFIGSQVVRPQIQNHWTIAIPYYNTTPLLYTPQSTEPLAIHKQQAIYALLEVWFVGVASSNISGVLTAAVSAGDDFELHFPLPMPPSRVAANMLAETVGWYRSEGRWVRDLTREGVEKNPGPLQGWLRKKLLSIVDDIIADQTEKGKKKLQELKSFLLKHMYHNVIEDVVIPALSVFLDITLHLRLMALEKSMAVITTAFVAIGLRVYPALKDGYAFVDQLRVCVGDWFGVSIPKTAMKDVHSDGFAAGWYDSTSDQRTYAEMEAGLSGSSKMGITAMIAVTALSAVVSSFGFGLSEETVESVKQASHQKNADSGFMKEVRNVATAGQAVQGVRNIWNGVKDGIAVAMDFFMEPAPEKTWWEQKKVEVEQFFGLFDVLKAKGCFNTAAMFNEKVMSLDESPFLTASEVMDYYQPLIQAMAMNFPKLGKDISVDQRRKLHDIITMSAKVKELRQAATPRSEPVGIWIYGGVGTGKSVLCKEILPSLVPSKCGMTGPWAQHVYQVPRNEEQKYWDGYTGQFFACVDDFGQATDDKDFVGVITLISTATCPVPMAHMDDKLTTMTSKVVACSTNVKSVRGLTSVKSPDAVERRFPIAIHVTARNEGGFNYLECMNEMAMARNQGRSMTDVWDRHVKMNRWNLKKPEDGEEITLDLLVNEIVEHVKQRSHPCPMGDLLSGKGVRAYLGEGQVMTATSRSASIDEADMPVDTRTRQQKIAAQMEMFSWTTKAEDVGVSFSKESDDVAFEHLPPKEPKPQWDGLKSLFKWLGIASLGALALYFIAMLLRSFIQERILDPPMDGDMESKYTGAGRKAAGKPKAISGTLNSEEKEAKILRNVVEVSNGVGNSTKALVVDSRHIIIPRHLVEGKNEVIVKVVRNGKQVPLSLSLRGSTQPLKFLGRDVMNDALLVRAIGANLDGFPSIQHLIMTEDQWKAMPERFDGVMAGDVGLCYKYIKYFYSTIQIPETTEYENGALGFTSLQGTVKGDCGTPYFARTRSENTLIGIHAGQAKQSFDSTGKVSPTGRFRYRMISPLCRDDLEEAKQAIDIRFGETVAVEPVEIEQHCGVELEEPVANEFDEGKLTVIGKCTWNGQEVKAHIVPTTSLMKSPIQNPNWSDDFLPSRKKVVEINGQKVHPLYTNAQKYELRTCAVSPSYLEEITRQYVEEIPKGIGRRLTEDEILNGKGQMNRIVTKTSCGLIANEVKKEELFDVAPGVITDGIIGVSTLSFSEKARKGVISYYNESFCDYMDRCDRMLQFAHEPLLFWTSTLKDELRPIEKVAKAKTRVFENPDFIYTLLCRKYFGDFIDWFKTNRGSKLHHAIGIDREVDCVQIWNGLKWKERLFDVDYSNFDGTIPQFMFDFFLNVTDHFYGKSDRLARHTLVHTMRNAKHVIGENIYESYQGNKSGNAMTDVFNSVVNVGLFYLSFLVIYPNVKVRDAICLFTYGDDAICSVNPNYDSFNRVSHANLCSKLGLTVTPAKKGTEIEPFTDPSEVSFLKSVFKPGQPFSFPLPMEVIHRELMWQHKQNQGDTVVLGQRIDNAMSMVTHHGKQEFDKLANQIRETGHGAFLGDSYESRIALLTQKQSEGYTPESEIAIDTYEKIEASMEMWEPKASSLNVTSVVLARQTGFFTRKKEIKSEVRTITTRMQVGIKRMPTLRALSKVSPKQNFIYPSEILTIADYDENQIAWMDDMIDEQELGELNKAIPWRDDGKVTYITNDGPKDIAQHKTWSGCWMLAHRNTFDGLPWIDRYEATIVAVVKRKPRHGRALTELLNDALEMCDIARVYNRHRAWVAKHTDGVWYMEPVDDMNDFDYAYWLGPQDCDEVITPVDQIVERDNYQDAHFELPMVVDLNPDPLLYVQQLFRSG